MIAEHVLVIALERSGGKKRREGEMSCTDVFVLLLTVLVWF